jgi:glutamine cyclotransferase
MVRALDHDPAAFTQGLVYEDGVFYESTGLYGRSSVRRLDASTGEILHRVDLGGGAFGEGLTLWNDKLYQLTWKENRGFIYDKSTLARVGVFSFPSTEGWGLTHDESRFIFSDGSDILYFLDPESFAVTGRISVRDPGGHVPRLNELEYVDGEIWANVLQTDRIARIDPETGRVVGWIDLTGLLTPEMCAEPIDVMNGIAYDAAGGRVFVTGKHWCLLFEIRVE